MEAAVQIARERLSDAQAALARAEQALQELIARGANPTDLRDAQATVNDLRRAADDLLTRYITLMARYDAG